VTALPVIKHFDIFKNILLFLLTDFVVTVMNELYLESMGRIVATALPQQSPFLLILHSIA
jgi:hypothetical protein